MRAIPVASCKTCPFHSSRINSKQTDVYYVCLEDRAVIISRQEIYINPYYIPKNCPLPIMNPP